MNPSLIFVPVVVQILLTLALYVLLTIRKINSVKLGKVDEARRGLFDDAWPEDVIAVNNCIRNQFELPVLFYVTSILLYVLDAVTAFSLTVACLFVASRILHAHIHTGSNYVPFRRRVFMVGAVLILVMLIVVSASI